MSIVGNWEEGKQDFQPEEVTRKRNEDSKTTVLWKVVVKIRGGND